MKKCGNRQYDWCSDPECRYCAENVIFYDHGLDWVDAFAQAIGLCRDPGWQKENRFRCLGLYSGRWGTERGPELRWTWDRGFIQAVTLPTVEWVSGYMVEKPICRLLLESAPIEKVVLTHFLERDHNQLSLTIKVLREEFDGRRKHQTWKMYFECVTAGRRFNQEYLCSSRERMVEQCAVVSGQIIQVLREQVLAFSEYDREYATIQAFPIAPGESIEVGEAVDLNGLGQLLPAARTGRSIGYALRGGSQSTLVRLNHPLAHRRDLIEPDTLALLEQLDSMQAGFHPWVMPTSL